MTNINNIVPFDISTDLIKRKELLERVISTCKKNISEAPEGTIYACPRKNRKTYRYYLKEKSSAVKKDETNRSGHFGEHYLDKSKEDLKKRLAEKKYYEKTLVKATRELKKIEVFLHGYEGDSLISAIEAMNDGIKRLIIPLIDDDRNYIMRWKNRECSGLGFDENDRTRFYSDRGERMRSKSEILIANALNRRGIPYKYEASLMLENGVEVHPDFTVLNIRKRKEMYWEHLGKIDDPGYVASNFRKYNDYRKEGIIPGVNLIITYESWKDPLGTKEIENMIKAFLI